MRRPFLRRGVRLKYDGPRARYVLLAPDRALVLDDGAAAVVRRLDGTATPEEIARKVGAAREDIDALLSELEARALVEELA